MTAVTLENLDFAAYRRLLERALPLGSSSALSDTAGRIVQADEAFGRVLPERALNELASGRQRAAPASSRIVQVPFERGTLIGAPVDSPAAGAVAYLWARLPPAVDGRGVAAVLSALAAVVAQHLQLNTELDDLAIELAERYEELNLVYHTEDQVNYFAEGRSALDQLVRNCCDYLDVRFAALIMRDKGIVIAHAADDTKGAGARDVPEGLRTVVYDRVVADGETLVLNDPDDPALVALCEGHRCRLIATPLMDGSGEVNGILAILNDASRPKFSNSDKNLLRVMARKAGKIVQVSYDPLTGLVNREGYEYLTGEQFLDTQQHTSEHAVLHIDIDQLHVVNETASHDAGDAIVKSVAALLRRCIRETDLVARLGGDEFGILLRRCPLKRAADIAEKLRESIADLIVPWTHRSLMVTASVGVAPIDERTESAGAALAAAALACDAAKELGKNRVHCYQHSDTGLLKRHHEMETVSRIQTALQRGLFQLYGQPIQALDAPSSKLHVEVLLRMRDDDGNLVAPGLFIAAAERYRLMPAIDRWVVSHAIELLNAQDRGLAERLEMLSINLSGQSLSEPAFLDFLADALSGLAVPLDRICFEITETAVVSDLDGARKFMRELKTRGCRFALDDFGAGLSSFGYLRSLPVDYLKIDGGLVRGIVEDPVAASMVGAVQQVARVMHLKTVAEFVENDAIRDMLVAMGVSFAQGYAIGKPQPLAECLVASSRTRTAVRR